MPLDCVPLNLLPGSFVARFLRPRDRCAEGVCTARQGHSVQHHRCSSVEAVQRQPLRAGVAQSPPPDDWQLVAKERDSSEARASGAAACNVEASQSILLACMSQACRTRRVDVGVASPLRRLCRCSARSVRVSVVPSCTSNSREQGVPQHVSLSIARCPRARYILVGHAPRLLQAVEGSGGLHGHHRARRLDMQRLTAASFRCPFLRCFVSDGGERSACCSIGHFNREGRQVAGVTRHVGLFRRPCSRCHIDRDDAAHSPAAFWSRWSAPSSPEHSSWLGCGGAAPPPRRPRGRRGGRRRARG